MSTFSATLSIILFAAFLGWGVYTLRLRYRGHEDMSLRLEAITLGFAAFVIAVEFILVQPSVASSPVLFVFTILGLAVATTALYGPTLVSVASNVFVETLMPKHDHELGVPQFGPIEALERIGDFEGALQECMVVARIFPKDPSVALRIADNLVSLERFEEAAEWFERGLARITDGDRSFRVTTRLAEIYERRLDRPADAERVLRAFVQRYPNDVRVDAVRGRIERMSARLTPVPIPDIASE